MRQTHEGRPDGRRRYHPTDFNDALWQRLIEYGIERSDAFRLALPHRFVHVDYMRSPLWPPTLEAHRGAMTERYVSHVRGDRSRDKPTEFAVFGLKPPIKRLVRGVSSLQHWDWRRGLPEDPTFLAGDKVMLTTESRQGRITVYADEHEFESLSEHGVRLIEPLGVKAAPWPTP